MSDTIHETKSDYSAPVPLLYSGDVLDTEEFIRRYEGAAEKVCAERINGRVYLMSPLRAASHGGPHALLSAWLVHYTLNQPNLSIYDNTTIRLGSDNDPQPDLVLVQQGGSSRLIDDYIHGPPELIVEIAGSSASYDFGEKKDVYEAAGVREYLVFETLKGRIVWWRRIEGRFVDIAEVEGIYRSELFSGLWLDADALRSADARRLIETLQGGIESVGEAS